MNSRKVYYILIFTLIILFAGSISAVYLGNKNLQKSSESLLELKLEKSVIDEQKKALTKATKDLVTYTELESIANKIVPKDKDQAKSVREITTIAQENGITISNISFPTSNLGVQQPKKQSSSTESQSTEKQETAPPVSQVEAAQGLKGVYKLEVTVQSDESSPVSFDSLVKFLSALENNRRTAQVSSINITPDEANPSNLTFTLTINVFIKP